MNISAEELKLLLSQPIWLLLLMFLGSLVSALKQLGSAQRDGASVSIRDYVKHWPETFATIGGNVIGFILLLMSDQLNAAAAIGVGYGVNSVADMIRAGGRSASLKE